MVVMAVVAPSPSTEYSSSSSGQAKRNLVVPPHCPGTGQRNMKYIYIYIYSPQAPGLCCCRTVPRDSIDRFFVGRAAGRL